MAYKNVHAVILITSSTDVLCGICQEEVGKALRSNDDEEEYDFCPECGENIIKSGEEMCYQCWLERQKEDEDEDKEALDWDEIAEENTDDELFGEDENDDEELTELEFDEDIDMEE